MTFDVVWLPAPFRDGGRPYVVLSDDDHPLYGEEYVVVGVTTTERLRGFRHDELTTGRRTRGCSGI